MHQRLTSAPRLATVLRCTVTVLTALALSGGAVTALAPKAHAEGTSGHSRAVVDGSAHGAAHAGREQGVQYVEDSLYAAGDTGYLHRPAEDDGSAGPWVWSGFDGSDQTVRASFRRLPGQYKGYRAATDVISVASGAPTELVRLLDMRTGAVTEVALPEGQYFVANFGTTVVTLEYDAYWQVERLHILRPSDDGATVTDIPVEAPGYEHFHDQVLLAGDQDSILIRFRHAYHVGLLDLATGEIELIRTHARIDEPLRLQAALSPRHIALYEEETTHATVLQRDDPTGARTEVAVPQSSTGEPFLGLAGDWLLTTYVPPYGAEPGPGGPLRATPLQGGESRTLLPAAGPRTAQMPSGGAVSIGRTAEGGWMAHRVEQLPNGELTVRAVRRVDPADQPKS